MMNTWYGEIASTMYEHLTDPNHLRLRSPHGMTPTFSGPKPLVSPYGPNYSMHPELSRPAIGMITSTAAAPVAFAMTPVVLFELNRLIIEDSPEEQQRGLWQMFSSALTGTFGGDYSGLI